MNPTPEKSTQRNLPLSKPAESSYEPAYHYGVERCRFCAERHAWEPSRNPNNPPGTLELICPIYGSVAKLSSVKDSVFMTWANFNLEIFFPRTIDLTQNRYHHVMSLPERQLGQWQQDGSWDFLAPPAETARDIAARLDQELALREVARDPEDQPILAVAVTLQDLESLLNKILDEEEK